MDYNIKVIQGTDQAWSFPVTDGDTGDPLDVTDWTIRGQVRPTVGSTEVLHEWSVAAGNVERGLGAFTIRIDGAESSEWDWREGVYDIEGQSPQGARARFKGGRIVVDPEVTR